MNTRLHVCQKEWGGGGYCIIHFTEIFMVHDGRGGDFLSKGEIPTD